MTLTRSCSRTPPAFTLLEMLAALTVFAMLMVLIAMLTDQTGKTLSRSVGKIDAFRNAQVAFDSLQRSLSQATLGTYWDYEFDPSGSPTRYVRKAHLQFLTGPASELLGRPPQEFPTQAVFFHALLGIQGNTSSPLDALLNGVGYYVAYESDERFIPEFATPRRRFRLMQFIQPSERFSYFTTPTNDWFRTPILDGNTPMVRVLSDNVIALIVLPKKSPDDAGAELSTDYRYDSTTGDWNDRTKNLLPPLVEVTIVAIDEPSAVRLEAKHGSAFPLPGLNGLFQNAANFSSDLESLSAILAAENLNFRIFSASVSLQAAKWSSP